MQTLSLPEYLSLVTKEATKVALSDKGLSAWLFIGQSFEGFTISSYEPAVETVVLTKGSDILRVRLKDARITESHYDVEGSITVGSKESVRVVHALLIFDQETIFPLNDGMILRLKPTRQKDGNIRYKTVFERAVLGGSPEIIAAPSIISAPGKTFELRIGELAVVFKPTGA